MAVYSYILKQEKYSKKKKKIRQKKSLVWKKKGSIKTTSSFNAVNYKFKNIVIKTYGSCLLRTI